MYDYVVVLPYSSNLISQGKRSGNARLSFYSCVATKAASLLKKGMHARFLLLCGEDTFGNRRQSTQSMIEESLLRIGVDAFSLVAVPERNLNNTPLQIEALARYQRTATHPSARYAILAWAFHKPRIEMHAKAYGLNAEVISIEDVMSELAPRADVKRLTYLLPKFDREPKLRLITKVDGKGRLLKLLTRIRGASVTDIRKVKLACEEHQNCRHHVLELVDSTGPKVLRRQNN